jgi:hypothetical protein
MKLPQCLFDQFRLKLKSILLHLAGYLRKPLGYDSGSSEVLEWLTGFVTASNPMEPRGGSIFRSPASFVFYRWMGSSL